MLPLGESFPGVYPTSDAASAVVPNAVLSKVRRVSVVSFIVPPSRGRTRGTAPRSDGENAGRRSTGAPQPLPPGRSLFESLAQTVAQPCKIVSIFLGMYRQVGAYQ